MERDLTIRFRLDKAAAERASADFFEAHRRREAKALSDAEVLEKGRTAAIERENRQRVAAEAGRHKTALDLERERAKAEKAAADERARLQREQDREARRALAEKLRAEKAAAAERGRLDREAAREARRELAERAKAERRALAESRRAAAEALREQAREEREAAARRRSWSDRLFSEAEAREKAQTLVVKRENLARVDAYARAYRSESELTAGRADAFRGLTSAVGSFAGQLLGLTSAMQVVGEISASFQRARESIYSSTEKLADFREGLLELAALKDRLGRTDAEVVDTLRMQVATGQRREDVIAMQKAAIGVGESAIGRTISRKDWDESLIGLGQQQAVEGGDADAYGKLLGFLANSMGKDLKAPQVVEEAAALYQVAKPGGFEWSSAMKQFGSIQHYVASGVLGRREAMGLEAAYSIAEPDQAGTRVDQLVRATIGGLALDRRVRTPEGVDAQGTASYLSGLGAEAGQSPVEIAKLVAADLQAKRRAADAKGEGWDPYSYLTTRGYGEQESRNALVNFANKVEDGTWKDTFEPLIDDPNLGKDAAAEVRERLAQDPAFLSRSSKAAEEIGAMAPGAGRGELLASLRRMAWGRLKSRPGNESLRPFDELETSSGMNWWASMEKSSVNNELAEWLGSMADREGIPYRASAWSRDVNTGEAGGGKSMTDDEVVRVADALRARGVNLGAEAGNSALDQVAAKIKEAADGLTAATRAITRGQQVGGGRPQRPASSP